MIGKFEVRPEQFHFGHVAGDAFIAPHGTSFASRSLVLALCGGLRRATGFMTNCALRVAACLILFQIQMWIVACSAYQMHVLGIVSTAVKQPVRLEANIADAPKVRHHGDSVDTTMTSPAEFLR